MQNCGMAPPFVTWAEALSTQKVREGLWVWPPSNFGQKVGLHQSEDLFLFRFFALHLILARKIGLSLGETIFSSDPCSSQIF